ncbi:homoserine kinase [Magnetococcales bacterium HHB-1]
MSVYTSVTPEDLQPLLEAYPLGALQSLTPVTEGLTNTIYFVTTAKGKYVLILVESQDTNHLPFLLSLMRHLHVRHIPCPLPLADNHQKVIHKLHGRPAFLITLLEGRSVKKPSPLHCSQIGDVLARIHLAGEGFHQQRSNPMCPQKWERLLTRVTPALQTTQPDTLALLRRTLKEASQTLFRQPLPLGICHADLFSDNTLFDNGVLTGVIDFDFACTERFIYDIAVTINAWCFSIKDGQFLPELFNAFMRGYRAVRALQPEEEAILPVALRAASLRFALTRLHDQIFPRTGLTITEKPPQEYLDRLAFHWDCNILKEVA